MGKLFLVSTPIGNLEDTTLRAIKTFFSVEIILCEDTRKTGILLTFYRSKIQSGQLKIPLKQTHGRKLNLKDSTRELIKKQPKLVSYYEENEEQRIPEIINYLKKGKDVALVSNSGTPTISDPGFKLVKEAIKNRIEVVPIPGPSAILAALVTSGFPTDKFLFLGYLPKKKTKRKKLLRQLHPVELKPTIIFFESPYRLVETLKDLKEIFGNIEITIARELTKLHEEVWRGKISQASAYFKIPKGEFTILFNFNPGG